MMRLKATMFAVLPVFAQIGPLHALEASDTMAAWKRASAAEKGVIVDKVLHGAARPRVIECMNAASGAPGHGDLPIQQMIKACDKNSGNEPV